VRALGRSIRVFKPGEWFVSNFGRGAGKLLPPVSTVPPAVTGVPQSSNKLTCSEGEWDGDIAGIAFQWYRNNVPMIGETGSQLTIVSTYIGDVMKCGVTASNASGSTQAMSNEVTIIP
jgi:hypothetical protein